MKNKNYMKISQEIKITFLTTIFIGIIAHLYMYTNRIVNHDAVFSVAFSGSTYTNGRWLLELMSKVAYLFNGNYVTPWGIGAITLILYAIAACLLVKTFNMKNKYICGCLGAIVVVYPTVTANNLYIFTAHYYAFAFLLVTLATYLISRYNYTMKNIMVVIILIVCSLGIYQGYFPFFVTEIMVFLLLKFTNKKKADLKDIAKNVMFLLGIICSGMIIYLIINKMFLKISHTQLDAYLGMNDMGKLNIFQIPQMVIKSYKGFIGIFLKDQWGINNTFWLKLVFITCIIFILWYCFSHIIKDEVVIKIGVILFCILFPLGVNLIYIMCQVEKGINTMTVYSTIWILLLPLIIIDQHIDKLYIERIVVLISCIVVAYYSTLANQTYVGLEYSNKNVEAYFIQLATRIKMLDGYSEKLPVAFVGKIKDESIPDIPYDYSVRGNFKTSDLINTYSREYFMKMSCGYNIQLVKDTKKIKQKEEFVKMSTYPNKNGIKIIDNIIVVKFSNK